MPQHHISNILAVAFTLRDLLLYSAPCAHSPLPITLLGLLPEHDLREQGLSLSNTIALNKNLRFLQPQSEKVLILFDCVAKTLCIQGELSRHAGN